MPKVTEGEICSLPSPRNRLEPEGNLPRHWEIAKGSLTSPPECGIRMLIHRVLAGQHCWWWVTTVNHGPLAHTILGALLWLSLPP